ncbi:MAG: class I SAM-dependent methyltransferase [Chloroflexi bacterium]|nr:class I SAM-dependent methyltransferase [Chloroflexota bacterium]
MVRQQLRKERLTVLDVGGYPGYISAFLPDEATYIVDNVPGVSPGYVVADGRSLPFSDASIDVVVSADTLEHIPKTSRTQFLAELSRVSGAYLILIAPFADPSVEMAETILFEFVRQVMKTEQQQLKEHLQNGLPELADTCSLLTDAGLSYIAFPSGYLHHWLMMMFIKHYLLSIGFAEQMQGPIDEYYNRHFSLDDHRAPSYRQVIVAAKGAGGSVLESIKARFSARPVDTAEQSLKLQSFQILLKMLELRLINLDAQTQRLLWEKDNAIANLQAQLGQVCHDKDRHTENLEHLLREKDSHIDEIENCLAEIESRLADVSHELERVRQGKMMRLMRALEGIRPRKDNK